MSLNNNIISNRQCFRMEILENIALGIVLIPFITVRTAGKYHFWAFALGLSFICIYGAIMLSLGKLLKEGMIETLNKTKGAGANIVNILYVIRYLIRVAFILIIFSQIIKKYLLEETSVYMIAAVFLVLCGYGAMSNIEKRGRMLELVFWWMLVPLIITAVLAISSINWGGLCLELFDAAGASRGSSSLGGVILGAYLMLVVVSSGELMMFTFPKQKHPVWQNGARILAWLVIIFVFAYIFVMGILGAGWSGAELTASLNVMDSASFPGGLMERMDYPVLAFWIIGAFALISGYLYYSKEFVRSGFRLKKKKHEYFIMLGLLVAAFALVLLLSINIIREAIAYYIIIFDVAISILAPVIVLLINKKGNLGQEAAYNE